MSFLMESFLVLISLLALNHGNYIQKSILGCDGKVYWNFDESIKASIQLNPKVNACHVCRDMCHNDIDCDAWGIHINDDKTCNLFTIMDGQFVYDCKPNGVTVYEGELKACLLDNKHLTNSQISRFDDKKIIGSAQFVYNAETKCYQKIEHSQGIILDGKRRLLTPTWRPTLRPSFYSPTWRPTLRPYYPSPTWRPTLRPYYYTSPTWRPTLRPYYYSPTWRPTNRPILSQDSSNSQGSTSQSGPHWFNGKNGGKNTTGIIVGSLVGVGLLIGLICLYIGCKRKKVAIPNNGYVPMDDMDDARPEGTEGFEGLELQVKPQSGMGCKEGCLQSPHLKSWILTAGLFTVIIIKLICEIDKYNFCECDYNYFGDWRCECYSPCNFGCTNAAWIPTFAVIYILYLIEVYYSSSRKYLSNTFIKETVHHYVDRLKTYPPTIWWRVECYHYETRTRVVTYTDANGNVGTRTETYTEKVVTHTAKMNYSFSTWIDTSEQLTGLENYKLTKISYFKTFTFANDVTEIDYNTRLANFKATNNLDTHQDFFSGIEITDFKSKMLAEVYTGVRPECLKLGWYVLFSIFGMTTCYRMWFSSIVGSKKKYTFIKEINIY